MIFSLYRERKTNEIVLDSQLGRLAEGCPSDYDCCLVARIGEGATRFREDGVPHLGVVHGWRLSAQSIWDGDVRVKIHVYTGDYGPRRYAWVKVPVQVLWKDGSAISTFRSRMARCPGGGAERMENDDE